MFHSTLLHSLIRGIDPIHGKSIQLRSGQLFLGRITQLYPNDLAQLKLGGVTMTAKLEAKLEKGSTYWFRVIGGDSLPKLKVLEQLPTKFSEQTSNKVMQQMGIPQGKLSESLLHKLISENIPFTQQSIREAGVLLHQMSFSNDDLEVILQMLRHNLPLTKAVFLSMQSLKTHQSIGEALLILERGLKGQLQQRFPNLYEVIASLLKQGGEERILDTTGLASSLRNLVQQLGLSHEAHLAQQIQQSSANSLKSLLIQFNQEEVPEALKKAAEYIVHRVTAAQLLSQSGDGPIQQVITQIPFKYSRHYQDMTIQWEGRQLKDGVFDEEHCRILFYLNLKSLLDTVIDVQIQNRIVSITLYNDYPKPDSISTKWQSILKENLSSFQYELSTVKWVQREWNKKDTTTGNNYYPENNHVSYRGVDVRI